MKLETRHFTLVRALEEGIVSEFAKPAEKKYGVNRRLGGIFRGEQKKNHEN